MLKYINWKKLRANVNHNHNHAWSRLGEKELKYLSIGGLKEFVHIWMIARVTVKNSQKRNGGFFNKFLHCINLKILKLSSQANVTDKKPKSRIASKVKN